jgi:O-antigen/teichoic acid export membrane protein
MLQLPRIIRSFFSAAFMRVVSGALSFAFFVLLARGRGEIVLGEFSTVLAFFIFCQSLPLLGLHVPLVRDVAADHDSLPRLGANAALIGLLVAVPCGLALGLVGRNLYPATTHGAFWLVGASMLPTALVVVSESLLTGQERIDVVAALSVGENLLRLLLWLVVLWLHLGMTAFFAMLLLGRIAAVAGHVRWGRLAPIAHLSLIDRATLVRHAASCPTFLGILLLAAGINRLDFLLLSKLGTLRDVGLYAAAYKVYEMALMVPQLLSMALFPALARAIQRSPEASGQLLRGVFRIYLLLGLPCVLLILFTGRPVLGLLYGATFAPAFGALRWLVAAPLLAAIDQVLTTVLFAHHRQGLDLRVLIVSCGSYALLLAVLIPRFGYEGAAAATLLVAVLQILVRYWMVRIQVGVTGLLPAFTRPLAAAAVMAVVCVLLRALPVALSVAAGLAAYAAALGALGALSLSELKGMRAAWTSEAKAA